MGDNRRRRQASIFRPYMDTRGETSIFRTEVDPRGVPRGQCQRCRCSAYNRENEITTYCRCGHIGMFHREVCKAKEDDGGECRCDGYEAASYMIKECNKCGHDEMSHEVVGIRAREMDGGEERGRIGNRSHSGDVGGDGKVENEWRTAQELARQSRQEQHEKRLEQREQRAQRGGARTNAGRKRKFDVEKKPEMIRMEVTPCRRRESGLLRTLGLLQDVYINPNSDCTLLKLACRTKFESEMAISLDNEGDAIYRSYRGPRVPDFATAEELKFKKCWYFNPAFERDISPSSIVDEFSYGGDEGGDSLLGESPTFGNDIKDSAMYSDPSADSSAVLFVDTNYRQEDSVAGSVTIGNTRSNVATVDTGKSLNAVGSPASLPSPASSLSDRPRTFRTLSSGPPSVGSSCNLDEQPVLNYTPSTIPKATCQVANSEEELEKSYEAVASVYNVSVSLARLIGKLFGDDTNRANSWMDENVSDPVETKDRELLLVLKVYKTFLCGEEENRREWAVFVDRMLHLDAPSEVKAERMYKQLMARFKGPVEQYRRPVIVSFDDEDGVGDGLIGAYASLLQEFVISKHFEGKPGHKIPRKNYSWDNQTWKMVGIVMGHIVAQGKVAMFGISEIFKHILQGQNPRDISVTTADVPDPVLGDMLEKLYQENSTNCLEKDEREQLSDHISSNDLSDLCTLDAASAMFIPKPTSIRTVVSAILFAEVIGHRMPMYNNIVDGINEVCKLQKFVEKMTVCDCGLRDKLLDYFFPSQCNRPLTKNTLVTMLEFHSGEDNLMLKDELVHQAKDLVTNVIMSLDGESDGDGLPNTYDFLECCTGSRYMYPNTKIKVEATSCVDWIKFYVCASTLQVNRELLASEDGRRKCYELIMAALKHDVKSFGLL